MTLEIRRALILGVAVLAGPAIRADEPPIPPDAGLPVIPWNEARHYVGRTVIVQGRIAEATHVGSICFLNFAKDRSFPAVIHRDSYPNFSDRPDKLYAGKIVRIRGEISEYKGKPQIEVTRPEQITIYETEPPIPERRQPMPRTFNGVVTLATYNVLNLFDEYDDPYHHDEGTPAKPKEQVTHLAATIKSIDADVLAIQEVENRGILERFARAHLADLGYDHVVLLEGNDGRGIDCAVLSRLPVGPVTSYRHLRFPDESGREAWFQRDLLRARIEPPGVPAFDLFVVHLKSKRGGAVETETVRLAEAKAARRILDDVLKADAGARFVICGDFNDTWDSKSMAAIRGNGPSQLFNFLSDLPKETETYNVQRYRSMIDFMLASPAMGKHYVTHSARVVAGTIDSSGSDHNPVFARFDLREAPMMKSRASESTAEH